jgi:uncharacterized protein
MRKTVIALVALGLVVASSAFAANTVRISQVYYGGGAGSSYYAHDYIELFNSGATSVDIGGWALQYGSATGNFNSNTFVTVVLPAGATIPACGYYLVETGSAGTGSTPIALPVTADFTNYTNLSMSGSAGKVGLFVTQVGTPTTGATCAQALAAPPVDLFGWGTASCYEGTVKAALNYTGVAVRNGGGLTDTDNNNNDFTNMTQPYAMHTAASGYTNPDCHVVPAMSETWGRVKTLYR